MAKDLIPLVQELAALANRPHYTCEDWSYNCPAVSYGQPLRPELCTCSANEPNAEALDLLTKLEQALRDSKDCGEIGHDLGKCGNASCSKG